MDKIISTLCGEPQFEELRLAVDAVEGLEAYNRLQPLDTFPPILDNEYGETAL